jgi:hypothetical protein
VVKNKGVDFSREGYRKVRKRWTINTAVAIINPTDLDLF